MRVILLENIDKLGEKYEVKDVSDGYARNYLLKEGKARPATKEAMNWLKGEKLREEKKIEQEKKSTESIASKLSGKKLALELKVGEKDQLFESVSARKIAAKLKEEGFEVKENQVELKEPIKTLGDYNIKIKFDYDIEAEVKLKIKEEK